MFSSGFRPVPVTEEPTRPRPSPSDENFCIDDDDDDHDEEGHSETVAEHGMEPLEIGTRDDEEEIQQSFVSLPWSHLGLPSLVVTVGLTSPVLLHCALTFYQLLGRSWIATPWILHWFLSLISCRLHLSGFYKVSAVSGVLDILMFFLVYPLVLNFVIDELFTDVDNTPVVEWLHDRNALQRYRRTGFAIASFRLLFGAISVASRAASYLPATASRCLAGCRGIAFEQTGRITRWLQRLTMALLATAFALLLWCLVSVLVHFVKWPPPSNNAPGCDPIDPTECWLPFPSFHHMRRDLSTATGWRVNLKADLLPMLKGRVKMDPEWLNTLDGFSTMGPILFYLNGLKDSHDAGQGGLQGHANLALSTTQQSITFLLDVNSSQLIPHSAEIDYLDQKRPQVMLFPAYPLRHATHYAVVLVNATDAFGKPLPATDGMSDLLRNNTSDSDRLKRYTDIALPALQAAAPWISLSDGVGTLQMLFDFVTSSEQSQLGHIRTTRDAVLAHINSKDWDWSDHYREIRRDDYDCSSPGTLLARTVHGELDVPWLLDCFGAGCRGSFLNEDALAVNASLRTIGSAKFIVHIPCSLRAGVLGLDGGKPLRAVMEFGHGLFANRAESFDYFLQQLAHDEGYAVTAMDWRGMSVYDLFIVSKMLLSRPRLFRSIRDNLIQGYANKFALQHFSRQGEIWKKDAFVFEDLNGGKKLVRTSAIGVAPSFVFYGISQGGILGAGYSALSAGLIDRTVLGVPGTPFALVMSRSFAFAGYDMLMLLDLYDNRQVRMLLALCQLGWDSLEGSGTLATPVSEPFPPTLMQAGLGDVVVPSIAAEALARGMQAITLSSNPRQDIFGIPSSTLDAESDHLPQAVLTEILYEQEYLSLPVADVLGTANSVHYCVRQDRAMITQVAAFISEGIIIDPCVLDGCIRSSSHC